MKSKIFIIVLLTSVALFAQRDDKGLDFGNTPLPASVQSLSAWELISEASDDFNYTDKTNTKFTNTWAEKYLPDPGFVGPGQTRWIKRDAGDPGDPEMVKETGGLLEIRANPGPNNPASTDPKLDRFINCGIISSKTQVKYPIYMESRLKIANLENSSNFWLLNACDNEEIDIIECYGGAKIRDASGNITGGDVKFYTAQMSTNYHIWHRQGGQNEPTDSGLENCGGGILTDFTYQTFFTTDPNNSNNNVTSNWRDAYHTLGLLWTSPTNLTFFVDGVARNNGKHFVEGREATDLTGSFTDAKLQCPNPSGANCETGDLLANVQGQTSGGSPFPNRKMDDQTYIIIDTESHFNKPLEDIANLNDDTKNVIQVDWVRVYKPVGSSSSDRVQSLTWDNKSSFILPGETRPVFEVGETISIDASYATSITSLVEADLTYVAIQIRELDENNVVVNTSPFITPIPGTAINADTTTISYTIPTYFDAAATEPIPSEETLDPGHSLLILFFMQEGGGAIVNQNGPIVITVDKVAYEATLSVDELFLKEETKIVAPNPFTEKTIINTSEKTTWELYDLKGSILKSGVSKTIEGSELSNGIYLLKINDNTTIKVVKE